MSEDNSQEQDIGKLSYLLNQIKEPIVCVKCSDEFMTGQTDAKSLQDYSRIDVGFTESGIQLWCQRHQRNICHINFKLRYFMKNKCKMLPLNFVWVMVTESKSA